MSQEKLAKPNPSHDPAPRLVKSSKKGRLLRLVGKKFSHRLLVVFPARTTHNIEMNVVAHRVIWSRSTTLVVIKGVFLLKGVWGAMFDGRK